MAFSTVEVKGAWTLIGNNVTVITFQNLGPASIYIAITATNSAPAEGTTGLLYPQNFGELKRLVSELSISAGQYVWVRTASGSTALTVEV